MIRLRPPARRMMAGGGPQRSVPHMDGSLRTPASARGIRPWRSSAVRHAGFRGSTSVTCVPAGGGRCRAGIGRLWHLCRATCAANSPRAATREGHTDAPTAQSHFLIDAVSARPARHRRPRRALLRPSHRTTRRRRRAPPANAARSHSSTTKGAASAAPFATYNWIRPEQDVLLAGGTSPASCTGVARFGFAGRSQPVRPSGRAPPGSRKNLS